MSLEVSRETWRDMDSIDDKLSIMFDVLVSTHNKLDNIVLEHSKRLDKLEKDKGTMTVIATAGGSLIGVIIAIFVKWGFYQQ